MLDRAGAERAAQVDLIVHQLVRRIAQRSARTADVIIAVGHGEGRARYGDRAAIPSRRHAGRKAIGALGRANDGQLADLLPARKVADRPAVAEIMLENRGRMIDGDLLPVAVAIADIIAAVDARTPDVVLGPPTLRDIVVFLVKTNER